MATLKMVETDKCFKNLRESLISYLQNINVDARWI